MPGYKQSKLELIMLDLGSLMQNKTVEALLHLPVTIAVDITESGETKIRLDAALETFWFTKTLQRVVGSDGKRGGS